MTTKAKPCPLCGSRSIRPNPYGIECDTCGLWYGWGTRAKQRGQTLFESWNNRRNAAIDQLQDEDLT